MRQKNRPVSRTVMGWYNKERRAPINQRVPRCRCCGVNDEDRCGVCYLCGSCCQCEHFTFDGVEIPEVEE